MRRPLRSLAVVCALALSLTGASAAVSAPRALAGSYTVTACSPTTSAGAWQPVNTDPTSITTGNLCGADGTQAIGPEPSLGPSETGALYSEDVFGNTGAPDQSTAGWQFTAPSGTAITAVSYYAAWETDAGGWMSGMWVNGDPIASNCVTNLEQSSPCPAPSGPAQASQSQTQQVLTGLDAQTLLFGVGCRQVEGSPICNAVLTPPHAVEADLYSAFVTLSTSSAPSVSGESGALWSAGSVVSGTVPLSFAASDPTGISKVQVLGPSGQLLASQTESCNYSQPVPCPQLPSAQINVVSTQLGDGPEHLQLAVTDAAGNSTTLTGPGIVVDNNGPGQPVGLTAATSGTTVKFSWGVSSIAPQPVATAYAQLCSSSCTTPTAFTVTAGQLTAPGAGTYTLRVWLIDTLGKGSSANAAAITVKVSSSSGGSPPACCATKKPPPKAKCTPTSCFIFKIAARSYAHGRLRITLDGLPAGDRIRLTLTYRKDHRPRKRGVWSRAAHYKPHEPHHRLTITFKTARPTSVYLQAFRAKTRVGRHRSFTRI
jgi:hypothetical protein